MIHAIRRLALLCLAWMAATSPARAEDGYDLWLRYQQLPAARAAALASQARAIIVSPDATGDARVVAAVAELERGLGGLTGRSVPRRRAVEAGAVLLTIGSDGPARPFRQALAGLGREGYLVRSIDLSGRRLTLVAANSGAGVLYGAFALLRHVQTGGALDRVGLRSAPRIALRMLDHWDNLDGTVERGYAGRSIWNWRTLPDHVDARLTDYARANASIGINGAVLNNVNAAADSLRDAYVAKAAAIAGALRPYAIRVYLSARFSAPIDIGGLKTGDPLDPAVVRWWQDRADAIYRAIPDFGGFLVKASSEGQPGPGDYGRTHAEGANMLAAALAPHGGVVIWRAFVYSADNRQDRVKQAYAEFKPLDGKFAGNVLLQVKNGPLDFQPREPFHPLFGAMPGTPLMMEVQLTKEYLGQRTHLVYLGPLFEEVLRADTHPGEARGRVADVIDGARDGHALTGIAGVANIGTDRDWAGSTFNQANWYAFGRLAWDPRASSRDIAAEWIAMTFTPSPNFVTPVVTMMMASREAAVDYMTPLGLAHLMGTEHHYGPAPWVADLARPEWNPTYYHRADAEGIGFDRTAAGSDALAQYAPAAAAQLARDPRYLLWYHHLGWTAPLAGGEPLWDALVHHYDRGAAAVLRMQATWQRLGPFVDRERFEKSSGYLTIQAREARWWRDASIAYFQSLNHLPLPVGSASPAHSLAWYKALRFSAAPAP
jgi:alpha-glucuronidase